MQYIRPSYLDDFLCLGEQCPAPCAAPADMTWTHTVGDTCETGLSMACPKAAKIMLLGSDPVRFPVKKDSTPGPLPEGLKKDQLELMLDARKTLDIILQNRSLEFRSDVVQALTYTSEFDPMITTNVRYAYDELDWGYTEQPYRMLTGVVQLQGFWSEKQRDLLAILASVRELCGEDTLLTDHLDKTIALFRTLSPEECKTRRSEFDRYMAPREYLFENLLVYLIHRHYLDQAEDKTVLPAITFTMVSFAVIRAMAFRLYRDTGALTEEAFVALCRHYCRCTEENDAIHAALLEKFAQDPLYSTTRLQRLLWN